MPYVKAPIPSDVYHLTKKENLDSILEDGMIRRFDDTECWFCESLDKMKAYMEQTVLCEGKPYYAVGGQLCRYPKFVPEDYAILKLTPRRREGNWYRWDQEIPLNSPKELVKTARDFSKLKIGYRGDLSFKDAEVINVPQFLLDGTVIRQPVQTSGELREELREKLKEYWAAYNDELRTLSVDELIERAEEIAATQVCYSELRCIEDDLDRNLSSFLLRQDDPLSALRDAWIAHQNVDVGETFQSLLDDLYREQLRTHEQHHDPQTVRELLEAFPYRNFQLMTPSGFVDLTPSETEKLLHGESVMAHPGVSEYAMPIPAEEVLELGIKSLKRGEDGRWYVLTDYPTPQLDVSEQGFQMNM